MLNAWDKLQGLQETSMLASGELAAKDVENTQPTAGAVVGEVIQGMLGGIGHGPV
jgi:hypothetical protein